MKKEYVSPLIENYFVSTERSLAAGSTTFDTGDDLPPIDNGGDADDGEESDARRNYNTWDDFEDEED